MIKFLSILLLTGSIAWMDADDDDDWQRFEENDPIFRRSDAPVTMVAQQRDPSTDSSSEQEWIEEAIKDIAYYLRAHKFNEYDRRYELSEASAPRTYHRAFPRPPLRNLHWEVHKFCDESFLICIKYLWKRVQGANLRRADDTSIVIQEQHWTPEEHAKQIAAVDAECQKLKTRDNERADPFQGPLERFQWRTTASYFMCWYTMNEIAHLRHLGENCDNFAACLDAKLGARNQDHRADDFTPFACAQYSFCPDPCCEERHVTEAHVCELLEASNPCFQSAPLDQRHCTLNRTQNVDRTASILNQWNVSCTCPQSGFVWDSGYGICVDVDECMAGTHDCNGSAGQACLNLPGSFRCICKWGYIWISDMGMCMHNRAVEPIKIAMLREQTKNTTTLQQKSYLRQLGQYLKDYFKSSGTK